MGIAGPLLRALAAARLPAAVPARRLGRGAGCARWAIERPRCGRAPAWARGSRPAVLLCAQGLVSRVHNDVVLARDGHAPAGARLDGREHPRGHEGGRRAGRPRPVGERPRPPVAVTGNGTRWRKWPTSRSHVKQRRHAAQARARAGRQARGLRAHARSRASSGLRARRLLLGRDRLDAVRPRATPSPRRSRTRCATTTRCARRGRRRLPRSPYAGAPGRAFSFDFSFNSYPLAYERPGPEIVIYRLTGGGLRGPAQYPPGRP